jgi:hypothetical protein
LWTDWLQLCTTISTDTRLGATKKLRLAAEVADASSKAATSGMKAAYVTDFLGVLKGLLLSKQA